MIVIVDQTLPMRPAQRPSDAEHPEGSLPDSYGISGSKAVAGGWDGAGGGDGASIAVESEDEVLSNAVLHRRANQLARRLLECGERGDRVCVALDQSPEQVVAWLALMKAGMVLVPVDPSCPSRRKELVVRRFRPAIWLTQECHLARVPQGGQRVLALDDPAERAARSRLSTDPPESG